MAYHKFIVITILLAALASCNAVDDTPHAPISQMEPSELGDYLAQNRQPADSISYGIARYAMLSRIDHDYGNVRKKLEGIRKGDRDKGSRRWIDTDIELAMAVAAVGRTTDSTVFHHINRALPHLTHDVSHENVIRRYAQAAFATLMTASEEGNRRTIDLCKQAINYRRNHAETPMRPEIYTYLGQAAYDEGDMGTALSTISTSLKLAHESGNKLQEARAYAALATGFKNEGLFLQEKMVAEKALDLIQDAPISETKGFVARTLGYAYENRQQTDSALFFLNMACETLDSIHLKSTAEEIRLNDIERIQKFGCRKPDSALATRAQYLQVYTDALIDMGKIESYEENIEPTLSQNRTVTYYAIGICAAIALISIIGAYIFRNYQRKLHAEKDAHLENIRTKLQDITSQYNSTSMKLQEFKDRLDTAEENRDKLTQQIQHIQGRLFSTEDELQEAQTKLTHKDEFITNLRKEQQEQEEKMQEINRRFAHKEFDIADAVSNPRHFARDFLAIHPHFEQALKERSASISSHDVLLCILIVLDVSREDIANVLKIRPESLNVARHRLRTKLGLSRYDNLYTILRSHL